MLKENLRDDLLKSFERLHLILREVKQEYEAEGVEASDGEVIMEAIGRFLDLASYNEKQTQKFLEGMAAILENSGVSEAFKFAAVFLFLSSNGYYLNNAADFLYQIGYVK
jgi:hypothetical protein